MCAALALAGFAAACSSGAAPTSTAAGNASAAAPADDEHASLSPDLRDRVRALIGAEREVQLVAHVENPWLDQWQVGVADNGAARFDYAEQLCGRLRQLGAVDSFTEVQILDARLARAAGGVDVVEKSKISGVRCHDNRRLTAWPPSRMALTAS